MSLESQGAQSLAPVPPDFIDIKKRVLAYLRANTQSPLKLELLELQKQSVAHMVALRYSLLWDDMGLGKTAQALAVNLLTQSDKTLIFCPNNIKKVWFAEIMKFTHFGATDIYTGKADELVSLTDTVIDRFKFFIFNYETLRVAFKTRDIIPSIFYRISHTILDEVHRFRNSYILDYIAFYHFFSKQPSRILTMATGTPIDKYIGEVWPYLALMDMNPAVEGYPFLKRFPNQEYFNERYAILKGSKETKEGYMQNSYGYYQEKTFHEIKHLIGPRVIRREIQDAVEMPKIHSRYLRIPDSAFPDKDWDEVLVKFQRLARLQSQKKLKEDEEIAVAAIQKLRVEIALRKAWYTYKQSLPYLQHGPIVIFSEFIKPLLEFQYWAQAEGHRCLMVVGRDMSLQEREDNIEEFKKAQTPFLLATFGAMAEGENLQVSNVMLFNDIPWQPSIIVQAQRRIWRIGQARECYHEIMTCRGDDFVINVVLQKEAMVKKLETDIVEIQKSAEYNVSP